MPNFFSRFCLLRLALLGAMCGVLGADSAVMAQQRIEIVEAQLGFGGRYKIGCWTPLVITLQGGSEPQVVVPRTQFPDGDGQMTEIIARPVNLTPGQQQKVALLVRIGQLDASLQVDLIDDQGRRITRANFESGSGNPARFIESGDAATTRHLLSVGPNDLGLKLLSQEGLANKEFVDEHLVRVQSVELLPRHYLAYEGIDTVLLSTSDRGTWTALRADDPRLKALATWVELGGRLILFCGSNGGAVLGSNGPLEQFVPGTFAGMETLTDLRQLEIYSGLNEPFPGRAQAQLSVPHLSRVRGDVELSANVGELKLPLVVRARHGMGQVVFAGFDPDVAPFRDWTSRSGVVSRLVIQRDESLGSEEDNYYYDYASDLTETLHTAMEGQLETAGVTTPPFLLIVGLVLLYIAVIGPGDYLFVRYVLKRMEWTWVTFPLIVVATSAAAYWLANRMKGNDLITTQVEVVDVDTTQGLVRGTLWTHLFSPKPDSYTLTPAARLPDGADSPTQDAAVAWLGRPSMGIGGMNSTDLGSLLGGADYAWAPNRELLDRVPIEVWSTRTFVSRWHGSGNVDVDATLTRTTSAGVVGTVSNRSGVELLDAALIYQGYVWKLGNLPHAETATIEPPGSLARSNAPRRVRTWFEEDFQLSSGEKAYVRARRLNELPLYGLVNVMMFSDAAGGRKLTGAWNRYQHFVDLSHALDSQTAMLVGRVAEPRSELLRIVPGEGGEPVPTSMRGPRDYAIVIYRFLLPVGSTEGAETAEPNAEESPEERGESSDQETNDAANDDRGNEETDGTDPASQIEDSPVEPASEPLSAPSAEEGDPDEASASEPTETATR